jgi:hypothetical protein
MNIMNDCSVLPSGTGFDQSVSISSEQQYSQPVLLLSYGAPTINALIGCSSDPTPAISAINCAREGGDILTIQGLNFGSSGATVLIGSVLCLNVVHDTVTPNELVTCTLPAGNLLERPVILIQR